MSTVHGTGAGAETLTVTVEIAGILRRPHGLAHTRLRLPPGATVDDAVASLGYRADERRLLRVSRGGEILDGGAHLADGDALQVFTPLGGG